MKKNTKKRRTIRRLLIATAFALLMIPASVSADVVGKKITQESTPEKQNPLSKIEYTYRSDGKFDMVLTFDIFAAKYAVWHVDNAREYVLEVRSKTQNNQLIGSQIIKSADIRELNGKLVYDFKNVQKVPVVRPGEELSISFEFFSDYDKKQYANYGENFQPRTVWAPEAPNPNLLEGMTGYGQVEKMASDGTEYTEVYATFRGTQGPDAGEKLWAYNLDDKNIYGSSNSRTVKVWIYRNKINAFNIADQSPRRWMLVSATDPNTAASIAEASASKATSLAFDSPAKISYEMEDVYRFGSTSTRYDQATIAVYRDKNYNTGYADGVEIYNYVKGKGEADLYREFSFDSERDHGTFKLTGLLPGTTRYYTVHTIRYKNGLEYNYWDGYYYTVRTENFKAPGFSAVKMGPKQVKMLIKVPEDQRAAGLSTMYVYRGSKKIKTIKSNGKATITFTYSAKKANSYKYKVKAVCAKKTGITKSTSAKKPKSNTYKRPGRLNSNIDQITPYRTAKFVPWQISCYDKKIKVTGYIVNNRMFKMKKYKFKVYVYNNNKKIATKTVTYKNIKKYAKKKVTITIKTKKKPDFVNYSTGWGTSNVSTKWGW